MCEILSALTYYRASSDKKQMTIPSRPAPPPPPKNDFNSHHQSTAAPSRYTPTTDWDDSPFDSFAEMSTTTTAANSNNGHQRQKHPPPPRPPPPRLKKPNQPTSVNILSSLFGKSKQTTTTSMRSTSSIPPKLPAPPSSTNHHHHHHQYGSTSSTTSNHYSSAASSNITDAFELISFDSPPNSPTFTQKSHSDCTSIDSSNSDPATWSPHNTNASSSQGESGFEDDFSVFSTNSTAWSSSSNVDPFASVYDAPIGGVDANQQKSQFNSTSFYDQGAIRNVPTVSSGAFDDPLCNGKSLLPPPVMLSMPTIIKPEIKAKPKIQTKLLSTTKVTTRDYSALKSVSNGAAPQLPPPVLPSSTSSAIDDSSSEDSYAIVLYDFDALQDGDLSLRENEKVYLLQKVNDEWYFGKNRRGCEGMFPSSYIDVKVAVKEAPAAAAAAASSHGNSADAAHSGHMARALFNFNAEAPEDLTLQENDTVLVMHAVNDEWLYGKVGSRCGQFPANFIEYISS